MPLETQGDIAHVYLRDYQAGALSRRDFLTRITALGITAPAAYGLIGAAPALAQTPAVLPPVAGGHLRVQMLTRAMKDPVTWDWPEIANYGRGWLDYLVEYQSDGTLRGMLLDSWDSNGDATRWRLNLRQGVKWNNGDEFTTEDLLHNLRRWCDETITGNSMSARFHVLCGAHGGLDEGQIEVVDDYTLIITTKAPDIALMVNMADYPAAIVHRSFVTGSDPAQNPIGTGAYLPSFEVGDAPQTLRLNSDHRWWGTMVYGGPWLDKISYIDLGTDPAVILAAAEAGEIDATDQTNREFIELYDAIGWEKSDAVTAATVTVRFNQKQAPYDNRDVRRALQMAVDNRVVLEIGLKGFGIVGENHHVCAIQPDYAAGVNNAPDPAAARELLEATGHAETEFELISIDDDYQAATCDAVAAQLRDAGFKVKRVILPRDAYWENWVNHPFSATDWAMRPLGIQVLNLAYRTGSAWNETGFSNPDFDAALVVANAIPDADRRRAVMAHLQQILLDEAVLIQPYWRILSRHVRPGVHGMDKLPTGDHRHYLWWREAVAP